MPPARQRTAKRATVESNDPPVEEAPRKRTRSAAAPEEPKPAVKATKTAKATAKTTAAPKASRAKAVPKEPEPEEIVKEEVKPAPKAAAKKTAKAVEKPPKKSSAKETAKETVKEAEKVTTKTSKRTKKPAPEEETKDETPNEIPEAPVKTTSKAPAKSTSKPSAKAPAKAPAKAVKEAPVEPEPEEKGEDEALEEKPKEKSKPAPKEKPKAEPKAKATRAPAKRKATEDENVSKPSPSKIAKVAESEPTTRYSRRLAARKGISVEEPQIAPAPVKSRAKKATKVPDAEVKVAEEVKKTTELVEEPKETNEMKVAAPEPEPVPEAVEVPQVPLPQVKGDLDIRGGDEEIGVKTDQSEKPKVAPVPAKSRAKKASKAIAAAVKAVEAKRKAEPKETIELPEEPKETIELIEGPKETKKLKEPSPAPSPASEPTPTPTPALAPVPTPEALKIPRVSLPQIKGDLFTCGSGEQIGFRTDQAEKKRPALVPHSHQTEFCSVACGSMHSIAISTDGSVFTFGCNDECALGRTTDHPENNSPVDPNETELLVEETLAAIPEKVDLPKVVKATAGDSHTAALTEEGKLMICGCFRSKDGKVGLFVDTVPKPQPRFRKVDFDSSPIVDISSGCNHVLFLTQDGSVYSFGEGEHGQLGRFDKDTCEIKKDLSNVESFLTPQKVHLPEDVKCDRIWTSNNASFARTTTGELYAWGLNNYSQLGLPRREGILSEHKPLKVPSFSESPVVFICGGLKHTLALTQDGRVYSTGRSTYGSLGLGGGKVEEKNEKKDEGKDEKKDEEKDGEKDDKKDGQEDGIKDEGKLEQETFEYIKSLNDEVVIAIACGEDSSFAVTQSGKLIFSASFIVVLMILLFLFTGKLFSWGMASLHLGHDTAEAEGGDHFVPKQVTSKKLASAHFYSVATGSMHMISIASLKETNGN